MKKGFLLALVLFFVKLTPSLACSCGNPPEDFCSTISPERYILTAKVISKYVVGTPGDWQIPMMDVQVMEYLNLNLGVDTISIIGQDGVNCNAGLAEFQVGDIVIMGLFDYGNWFYPFPEPNNYLKRDLGGCGLYHLKVINNMVTGNITPTLTLQPYNEFVSNLAQCMVISSTEEEGKNNDLQLWPNPTTGRVVLPAALTYEQLEVRSLTGAVLMRRRPLLDGIVSELDLSHLAPGVYVLMLMKDGKLSSGRVVKT